MLGEIGGGRIEDAADPAIEREFAAADRVDRDAGRVGRVFDRKFNVELHRNVAEEAALHANEGDFVVELPRNVIARTDVNVFVGQALVHDRLNGFGLGSFLRAEPGPAQHIEEIGVAAGVELIGAFDFDAALPEKIDNGAMKHSRTELRFDVVTNNGEVFVGKTFGPGRIAGDENGDIVDESDPGFERAAGIELGRLFRTDGEIIDHDLGGGILELGNDLFAGGFFFQGKKGAERIMIGHMLGVAVEDAAHFHDRTDESDIIAKNLGAIRWRKDRFADVEPNFAAVDVKRGDDFDIARAVGTDLFMHEAHGGAIDRRAAVKVDSLDERAGTIAHSDDGDSDFSHGKRKSYPEQLAWGKIQSSRFKALRLMWPLNCEVL